MVSEQDWTTTPVARPLPTECRHEAVIDGLKVKINDHGDTTDWTVAGWLADVRTYGSDYNGYQRPVDEAKAQATRAAHRLYAAGVRGAISYPVECCDRLFATRDAADQHEGEHVAELERPVPGVIHFSLLVPERVVCGATEGPAVSMPEQGVTCRACVLWINEHLSGYHLDVPPAPEEADSEHAAVVAEEVRREAEASESGEGDR